MNLCSDSHGARGTLRRDSKNRQEQGLMAFGAEPVRRLIAAGRLHLPAAGAKRPFLEDSEQRLVHFNPNRIAGAVVRAVTGTVFVPCRYHWSPGP